MAQERLTMRKIKEILRLKYEAGLSNRAIAGACKISNSTVGEYLRRAEAAGIGWPLGELSEDELYQKLFGEPTAIARKGQAAAGLGRGAQRITQKGGHITPDLDGIYRETSGWLQTFAIRGILSALEENPR